MLRCRHRFTGPGLRRALGLLLVTLAVSGPAGCGTDGGDGAGGPGRLPSASTTSTRGPAAVPPSGPPETRWLTPAGEAWFDPEILTTDGQVWMTWQDTTGGVWVARLDPGDGTIREGSVRRVATDAAPMRATFNGPELGLDADGPSVWYTAGRTGPARVTQARLGPDGPGQPRRVTPAGFTTPMPTRRAGHPEVRVAALRRDGPDAQGPAQGVWFDAQNPEQVRLLTHLAGRRAGDGDARFVDGTALLVVTGSRTHRGLVEVVDTDTGGTVTVRPADGTPVANAFGARHPATGRIWVVAVVGGDHLVLWELDAAGRPHERTRITSPASGHPHLGSPELFALDRRLWVSFTVADTPGLTPGRTDQQVWLAPVRDGQPVRCDDGAPGPATRMDPEVLVTGRHVFVYAYTWDGTSSRVQRCALDRRRLTTAGPGQDGTASPAPPAPLVAVKASATGPGISDRFGTHLVGTPTGRGTGPGPRLLAFLPGTRGRPDLYRTFLEHARTLGYHVIGLAYPNDVAVNLDVCRGRPDPDCPAAARTEILWGRDAPGLPLSVPPADAAMPRLRALLTHLARTRPREGWDVFLTRSGEPAWSRLVLAGHSQGGGHAAFVARDHRLARVLLFAATEPAPWTTEPLRTPRERLWALAHTREPFLASLQRSWAQLGVPGTPVDVESTDPPWGGSHRLLTSTGACRGDPAARGHHHNCPIVDDWLPDPMPAGLRAAWTRMLTG